MPRDYLLYREDIATALDRIGHSLNGQSAAPSEDAVK